MRACMLEGQLATLEEPLAAEGITIGIEPPVEDIVTALEKSLGLAG